MLVGNFSPSVLSNRSGNWSDLELALHQQAGWLWKRRLHDVIWSAVPPVLIPCGLAGNLCAFMVLLRPRLRPQVVHLPLTVLSLVDCLVLLTGPTRHWLRKASYFVNSHGNELDPQAACSLCCKLHELLLYLSLMYSAWITALIAVERYAAVCVSAGSRVRAFLISRRGLAIILSGSLAFLLAFNLHFLVTRRLAVNATGAPRWQRSCENLAQHGHFVEQVFPRIDLALTAFLPFLVILACNSRILAKLRSVRRDSMVVGSGQSKLASYRTTVMLVLTGFAFVALTLPAKLYLTIVGGPQPRDLSRSSSEFYTYRVVWSVLLTLQFANHCCNFLLYCASNPTFRREAVKLFADPCCRCCSRGGVDGAGEGGASSVRRQGTEMIDSPPRLLPVDETQM